MELRKNEVDVIADTQRTAIPPAVADVLAVVERSLDDDLAQDVKVIPLAGKSVIADYMVIATGRSGRHLGAMTQHLLKKLKTMGVRGVREEGRTAGDWILLDAGDVIVHLFRPEVRAYYGLEKLWEADLPQLAADHAPSLSA